ncbi:hypothetical protein DFJ73DRAFT_480444 [Zopfochytrium polystomum]|nr:hypothetical protein DFJ73DRAFT_480444 [Zopfochytrium polystomum]
MLVFTSRSRTNLETPRTNSISGVAASTPNLMPSHSLLPGSTMDVTFGGISPRNSNARVSSSSERPNSVHPAEGTAVSRFRDSDVRPAVQGGSGPSAVDAASLYKAIRDTLTAVEFEDFAGNVAAFNASTQTAEETVRNIGRIVKDSALVGQMKRLIYTALTASRITGDGKNF